MKLFWIIFPIFAAVFLSFTPNADGARVCTINNDQCISRTGPTVCGRVNANNGARCKLFANACALAVGNCVRRGVGKFRAVNSTVCGGLPVGRIGNCQNASG